MNTTNVQPNVYLDILQLYSRQSHAIDKSDGRTWAETFTVDGTFTTPTYGKTFSGREELEEFARSSNDTALERGEQFRHLITNVMLDQHSEDKINSLAYLTITAASTENIRIDRSAVLADELVLVDGRWLVASRIAHRDG